MVSGLKVEMTSESLLFCSFTKLLMEVLLLSFTEEFSPIFLPILIGSGSATIVAVGSEMGFSAATLAGLGRATLFIGAATSFLTS
jgi:hypothetical protein